MELSGKTALVTGATGGLGQAIARRLRAEGCQLVLTGRRAEILEPLADELGARAMVADLAVDSDVDEVAAGCADVDLLVANAALPGNGLLEDYTAAQIDRVLAVNLRSPVILARVLGERMLARGGGHVVFVSSLSGKSATPFSSLYNATKFGLRGFALALRADWNPRGVGVSCVNPGPIKDAGMFHDSGVTLPAGVNARTPVHVADGVVQAVVRNKAELDVADPLTRVGANLALLAPQTVAKLTKLVGGDKIAERLAEGHKHNR